jgi:AcrR family transcriptional regulator
MKHSVQQDPRYKPFVLVLTVCTWLGNMRQVSSHPRAAPAAGSETLAAQTRTKVLTAAHASLTEVGIRRTSVEDVARRAGVSRATVYAHFRNKQTLVTTVLQSNAASLRGRLAERLDRASSFGEQLAIAAEATVLPQPDSLLLSLKEGEPELLALITLTEAHSWIEHSAHFWLPRVKAAQSRGELDADLDADAAAEWVARTLYAASVVPSQRIDLQTQRVGQIADYVREFLTYGLGPRR